MSTIEQRVMQNVGLIYMVRKLVGKTALELYILLASVWGMGQLIWVSKVFENLEAVGVENAVQFMVSAALHTDFLVQAVLLVAIFSFFSLLLSFFRTTLSPRTFAA